MKKTITFIVIFAVLLVLGSAATHKAMDGRVDSHAPMFRLERPDTVVALDDMKGHWVLLQFWASSDPKSRIAAREYTRLDRELNDAMPGERFRHLALNMDRSENLFNEIVRRDGLKAESQFHVEGDRAEKLIRDYHLESGLNTFLVDPEGRIVAKNPTPQQLTTLTNR